MSNFKFDAVKQKGTSCYTRKSIEKTFVDPYHNKIQNALSKYLRLSGQFNNVQVEKNSVDVQATSKNGELYYFEKSKPIPQNIILGKPLVNYLNIHFIRTQTKLIN